MNRAQRRATGAPKEPTYTLTRSQIQQMKKDCTEGRLETFINLVLDLYDSYDRDFIKLEDLEECLKEEAGLSFEEIKKRSLY